ncbi:MAG: FAD-dependent oxidoreductase [Elusimicrobiota bacterium]
MRKKVLLLGAGPTNLATADKLLDTGNFDVEVIERLGWTGGLSQSVKHGPYTLDLGPHRFTPHNDTVYRYIKDICGDELRIVDQKVEIYLNGKFLTYPFKLADVMLKLGLIKAGRIAVSFLATGLSDNKHKPAANYEEWIRSRFGTEVLKLVFDPLISKIWSLPLTQLASRFAWQRIAISNLWEILFDTIRGKRKTEYSSPYYPQNCFLYPKRGFGSIIDGMTERIKQKGGVFHLNATVSGIDHRDGLVHTVRAENAGVSREFKADYVVSTLPVNLLPTMLTPTVTDPAISAAAERLRFRRLILLFLVIRKDRVSPNTSYYFPEKEFPFGRTSEMKNHSPDCVPSTSQEPRTVFTLEVPCWAEDTTWKEPDSSIFERCMQSLWPTGIIHRDEVVEYFTVRLGHVYPVWDIDFEKNLETVLTAARPLENLIMNGRPGLFFYNNFHQSLEMGFIAADHIISGKSKAEKWDKDAELFREYRLVE